MANLLGEVDSNIPAPAPRLPKEERSGERRKSRALSPAADRIQKKQKRVDTRLPSPPAVNPASDDDDTFMPPLDHDPVPGSDLPMSDPAPSSPAAKAAQRKAQQKQDTKERKEEDDDDEEMMEVAHAATVTAASVNLTSSRPPKKLRKEDPYPSPASSSPVKPADATVDSSEWNSLTEKLNVVSEPASEHRGIGKIDHKDAIEADGSLNFFWTDYIEVNGSLCLFGKVLNKKTKEYVSCFVKVDNILRKLYFLPRQQRMQDGVETGQDIDMMDVYTEVDEIMTKMNVERHKIKACTRKYAFEMKDVPPEAQYMKLLYPYTSR
jgi:DNA polymerase alpha subunit A